MKIIISIVVSAGLMAVLGAVLVGVKSFDGTVTAKPYEEGLVWDETQKKIAERGWRLEIQGEGIRTGANDLMFAVLDKEGNTVALDQMVSVLLSRPSTDNHDMIFAVREDDTGQYRVPADFPLYGYWDITVKITQNEDDILIQKRILLRRAESG